MNTPDDTQIVWWSLHSHASCELSWSQIFDPRRDTLIRWRPWGSKETLSASKAHLAQTWHLSFSHGRRMTPLPWLLHSNIYANAFSLHGMTHCWTELTLLPGTAPSHTHRETLWTLCKIHTYEHINIHANTCTSKAICMWMLIWTYTPPRAGQKSAVFHVRPDAFSNSSTHKCIIRLF